MNAEILAEFYRLCGHRTFRAAGAWWYTAHPLFAMSVPYHQELSLSPAQQDEIFEGRQWVLGARYFASPSEPGKASFLIVCRDKDYDLQNLGHKARNQTRHGLRCCEVRALSWPEVAAAYDLQRETCVRQGRLPEFTPRQWARLCGAAGSLPGFEAWGAFAKGELAAFAVVANCDEYADVLYQYSRNALLSERPNNALTFTMTKAILARPGTEVICYGPEPLEYLANLNHFKFEMGYTQQPAKQIGVLNPNWQWAASPILHRSIVKISGWVNSGSSFRRIAGISRLVQATRSPVGPTSIETEGPCLLPARSSDCEQLAKLHMAAFTGFFLSSLGPRFLKSLYAAFLVEPSAICLVARRQDRIAGFVFGVCRPSGFVIRTLLRRGMLMAAVLLPVTIRRPAALFRVLRASLRPVFSEAAADEAVLFSIAVDPSLQNRGLGGQMVRAFLEEARRRGAKRVALTTDTQDNDAVNRFYLRLGFRLGSKFLTPEKRQMNEYVIDLAAAPEVTDHRLVAHQ